ncbi:MAG: 30S ribosomal protein S16 [Candidatus Omnitrophica bacterium]|nr:30S ribosomal protein S16 [Candidatus Omnitrophota bacterium]
MAAVIRMNVMGKKKKISHRIVVAHASSPRDGRFIAKLGYWDPSTEPETIKVDVEKANDWIRKGARPTPTTRAVLKRAGVQVR